MALRTLDQAILITWEWAGGHAAREDKIVAVLRPDLDPDTLAHVIETLYNYHEATTEEMVRYILDPDQRPNKAEATSRRSSGVRLICGHNPHLEARTVRNLSVETLEDEDEDTVMETVTWEEQHASGEWSQESFTQRADARWHDKG